MSHVIQSDLLPHEDNLRWDELLNDECMERTTTTTATTRNRMMEEGEEDDEDDRSSSILYTPLISDYPMRPEEELARLPPMPLTLEEARSVSPMTPLPPPVASSTTQAATLERDLKRRKKKTAPKTKSSPTASPTVLAQTKASTRNRLKAQRERIRYLTESLNHERCLRGIADARAAVYARETEALKKQELAHVTKLKQRETDLFLAEKKLRKRKFVLHMCFTVASRVRTFDVEPERLVCDTMQEYDSLYPSHTCDLLADDVSFIRLRMHCDDEGDFPSYFATRKPKTNKELNYVEQFISKHHDASVLRLVTHNQIDITGHGGSSHTYVREKMLVLPCGFSLHPYPCPQAPYDVFLVADTVMEHLEPFEKLYFKLLKLAFRLDFA